MKLAVVGRDSLPTLREWVETKFSDIPTTGISPPYPPWGKGKKGEEGRGGEEEAPEAFPSGTVGKLYKVVPVRDLRQLRILFPTPPLRELYKKKPSRYITHLLGHEGKGSILSGFFLDFIFLFLFLFLFLSYFFFFLFSFFFSFIDLFIYLFFSKKNKNSLKKERTRHLPLCRIIQITPRFFCFFCANDINRKGA